MENVGADFRAAVVRRMRAAAEPPSTKRVQVVEEFASGAANTVRVGRGEVVTALTRENGYVFVTRSNGEQGWIPESVCRQMRAD